MKVYMVTYSEHYEYVFYGLYKTKKAALKAAEKLKKETRSDLFCYDISEEEIQE